jgi:hypothetical protein
MLGCNGSDRGFYPARKGADFQRVLYYKKITIRFFNWETQMSLGYQDVHPIRNPISHCNEYCKDYLKR